MQTENSILDSIVVISKATQDSKTVNLNKSIHKKMGKIISEKLNCTTEEAMYFAIIFKKYYDRNSVVDISDIAGHLECDTIEVLAKNNILKSLVKKKLIAVINGNRTKLNSSLDKNGYSIKRKILDLILMEGDIREDQVEIINSISLVRNLADIMEIYLEKDISFIDVISDIEEIFEENKEIFLVEKIQRLGLFNHAEKMFLLYLIVKAYKGDDSIYLNTAMEDVLWDDKRGADLFKINLVKGKSILEDKKLIEIEKSTWRNDVLIQISDEGFEYLFGPEHDFFVVNKEKKKNEFEIPYIQIQEKPLFYNQEDLPTIDFMHDTLKEEKYQQITARLKEQNMPQGIAILLHGKPGTGKTETVYQVARVTERNIYKVEVSALKSMWFGESQRKIKKLFKDYYAYAEKQEKTPILLFNEADGVISKRKDSGSSPVAQTENEIQNILLQEMEDFKGILMATTNLIDNIDTAFDRRFLIKLELTPPNAFIRHQIIKHNICHLNDNDCWILAEDFEFTGGVLQNIIRKSYMHEVLYNEKPCLDWYINLCNQETLHQKNNKSKVGFK